MNTLQSFDTPELQPVIDGMAAQVVSELSGARVGTALASLFLVWVGICQQAEIDPGTEFERTLAAFEGRKTATHRAPLLNQ